MNIQRYAKKEIAFNQIETALSLYFEEKDLFSVVTLAGAAEEILGQLLQGRNGAALPFRSVLEILRPGLRKGGAPQGTAGREDDLYLHMDLQQEARFLIGRAIDDYQALSGTLSAGMSRFKQLQGGKQPQGEKQSQGEKPPN